MEVGIEEDARLSAQDRAETVKGLASGANLGLGKFGDDCFQVVLGATFDKVERNLKSNSQLLGLVLLDERRQERDGEGW